jgi:hypothetical protein
MSKITSGPITGNSSKSEATTDELGKGFPWGRVTVGILGLFAVAGIYLQHRTAEDEKVFQANLHDAGINALAPYLKKAIDKDLCHIESSGHFRVSDNKGIANQIIPYKARGAFHIFGWYPNRYKGYLQTVELRAAYIGEPGTKDKPAVVRDARMFLEGNDTKNVELADEDKKKGIENDPYVLYVLRQNKSFRAYGTPSEACRNYLIRNFHEVRPTAGS